MSLETNEVYHKRTQASPIVDYFYTIRPDLKPHMELNKKIGKEEEAGLRILQVDMLRDLADLDLLNNLFSCGRGFGKTMIAGAVGLYFADKWSTEHKKAITVLVVSSQDALYTNVGTFFRMNSTLRPRLKQKPVGPNEIPASKEFQFIDNNSTFIVKKATIAAVEGIRADVIILDETQDIETSVILKALGCSKTDLIGKVIVIGTPYHEKKKVGDDINWFIELVRNPKHKVGDIKFHLSQHSSELTAWNNVDMWRNAWNNERFNAECKGIVTERSEKCYFGVANIEKHCLDVEPDPEAKGELATREAGLDCGFENTVLTIREKTATRSKILKIFWWKEKPIQAIAKEIGNAINQWGVSLCKIDSKAGIGQPKYKPFVKEYTGRQLLEVDASVPTQGYPSTKECMRGQMLNRLRGSPENLIISIRLEYFEELYKQLTHYTTKTIRGDDLVDSLMLACYEPTKASLTGGGFVICSNGKVNQRPLVIRRGIFSR